MTKLVYLHLNEMSGKSMEKYKSGETDGNKRILCSVP